MESTKTDKVLNESYKVWHLYVDASLKGYGIIVYSIDCKVTRQNGKEVIMYGNKRKEFSTSVPWDTKLTNNEAEYLALIMGLKHCLYHGCLNVSVFSDSELVVRQVQGKYKTKKEALKTLCQQALELMLEFDICKIYHIKGSQNPADRLSRAFKKVKKEKKCNCSGNC
jgi:ribonuclease HI